ncbi:Guanine-nucleotide exchange factor c3g [Nesidiocoris tenuis]|uniref:Guanine-nucleotide exchange factor c3g n=1 Tax=Nesidiocoris tenuis TaxID=355587 RepID=A0ABN7APZ1_9HEMI|nr:Guanine-nucleotide exchange factor c3g [Nesidiocoris tenuis]
MTSTPKSEKSNNEGSGRAGNRLARRARSFKEDLLDILLQMRSPGSGGGGSGSPRPPRSPKPRNVSTSDVPTTDDRTPMADLDQHVKQVQLALKHFNDVVSKNKLEVLPGNGTIVLESIATIQGVLKTYVFIDQSSALMSATNQVYHSLTTLIKLCDDVLFTGDKNLSKLNVTDVLQQVNDAVQNLLRVVRAKITDDSSKHGVAGNDKSKISNRWEPGPLRSSLPDISLGSTVIVTDAVDSAPPNPPTKPPLPSNKIWLGDSPPPPLPPKKKSTGGNVSNAPSLSMERLSLRSDNSSLGSLDSMLNTSSKDEEELRAIIDEDSTKHDMTGLGSIVNGSQTSSCWDNSSCSNTSDHTHMTAESPDPSLSNATGYIATSGFERSKATSGFTSLHCCSSSNQSSTYNYSSTRSTTTAVGMDVSGPFFTASEDRKFSSRSCSTFTSVSSETSMASLVQHPDDQIGPSISIGAGDSIPPLPEKKRCRKERQPSQYDNVPNLLSSPLDSNPPPLPLKKKHIMAYMEMFGNCSQPNASELLRHSVHTYSLLQAEWQQASLSSAHSCSFATHSSFSTSHSYLNHELSASMDEFLEPGGEVTSSPKLPSSSAETSQQLLPASSPVRAPPALPPKRSRLETSASPVLQTTMSLPAETPPSHSPTMKPETEACKIITNGSMLEGENILYELDGTKHLVMMRPEDGEGVAIRGGHINALIIHATRASKNAEEKEADILYQEAFLTTYRTFLTPHMLVEKLCSRHQRFCGNNDPAKQRAARETFSLLVRAISDLTVSDLDDDIVRAMMDFIYQLISAGDLTMARVLRVVVLDKYAMKQQYGASSTLLPSQNIYTRQSNLVEFKSEQVAEQMTLLDSELFMKIEIPEVLIWAQEQNEERSPNLTRFTEHFNKMSYWARSRILEQGEAKERERYVVKFIKIMKHLRKINNFNSYLALLSALDSAPIRRLEWQKHITEGLKEYCALIDSSSSFRAYRQALAETQPPCIPYIGLVLQDLTFVHIGNSDYLSEGVINFSKRWQQFNIVENMKRFKKGAYNFKKNERIIAFFSNFDDFLCEEAMWQISESIKPRGSKKPQ